MLDRQANGTQHALEGFATGTLRERPSPVPHGPKPKKTINRHLITPAQHTHLQYALTVYKNTHGLLWVDISRQCKVGKGTIAALVRGECPTLMLAERIADGLAMPLAELLGPPEPIPEQVAAYTIAEPEEPLPAQEALDAAVQMAVVELRALRHVLEQLHEALPTWLTPCRQE